MLNATRQMFICIYPCNVMKSSAEGSAWQFDDNRIILNNVLSESIRIIGMSFEVI